MKKFFAYYGLTWTVATGLFVLISLIVVNESIGIDNAETSFWIGFGLACVALVLNLLVSLGLFKEDNANKVFMSLPIVAISFGALIVSFLVSLVVMIVAMPVWVAVIVDAVVLGGYLVAINSASANKQMVTELERNIIQNTETIKLLTASASALITRAQTKEMKAVTTKVYEALRYSDPVSNENLKSIEVQIQNEFNTFTYAVSSDNLVQAQIVAENLLNDIKFRNESCKAYKQYTNRAFK